jgi:hypothetical protein
MAGAVKLPVNDVWNVRIGADFSVSYLWTADGGLKNMAGWSGRCQARAVDTDTMLFDVSTADHITLGATSGLITVTLPRALTELWAVGRYVADLDLTSAGNKKTPFLRAVVLTELGIIHD